MSETIITSVTSAILGGVVGALSALAVEKYRSKLEDRARYNQSQFDTYRSLWSSLDNLKVAADALWKSANRDNLRTFADQLQKTKTAINQSRPFIEAGDLNELDDLMGIFEKFEFGKRNLITLRKNPEEYNDVHEADIRMVIRENEITRDRYNKVVNSLEISIRRQLRGH